MARRSAAPAPSAFSQGVSTFMQCFKAPAAELFSKHLRTNPGHFDSWLFRGKCYSILGKKDEAISDFTSAEKVGNPCQKMIAQGMKLEAQEKYEDANSLFKQATVEYPGDRIAWQTYGTRRFYQQHYDDETITALKKASSSSSHASEDEPADQCQRGLSHYLLGMLMDKKGETAQSIEHLREGLRLNPTCTINYIELGQTLPKSVSTSLDQASAKKVYAESKALLFKALELNDTQIQAHQTLAKIFFHEEDYDNAVLHAAIFLGNIMICNKSARDALLVSKSAKESTSTRASTASGSNGGSNDSDSDESDESDDDDDDDELARKAKTWQNIKENQLQKAKHNGSIYYQIKDKDTKVKIWVSDDKAGHAGAAFKVWKDMKRKIVFLSSFDADFKVMPGKNESLEGKEIKKSDMNFLTKHKKK